MTSERGMTVPLPYASLGVFCFSRWAPLPTIYAQYLHRGKNDRVCEWEKLWCVDECDAVGRESNEVLKSLS